MDDDVIRLAGMEDDDEAEDGPMFDHPHPHSALSFAFCEDAFFG